jgi:hypothetical protein
MDTAAGVVGLVLLAIFGLVYIAFFAVICAICVLVIVGFVRGDGVLPDGDDRERIPGGSGRDRG